MISTTPYSRYINNFQINNFMNIKELLFYQMLKIWNWKKIENIFKWILDIQLLQTSLPNLCKYVAF